MNFSNTIYQADSQRIGGRSISQSMAILLSVLFCLILAPTQAQLFGGKQALLPEEQAFGVTARVDNGKIIVNWSITQDYYMYRDQFRIQSADPNVTIGDINFPKGQIEDDPEFGQVEVYFFNAELSAPIQGSQAQVEVSLLGQGCNKPVGVCYPPQTRKVNVTLDETALSASASSIINNSTTQTPPSASKQLGSSNDNTTVAAGQTFQKTFWGYVLTELGAGILLSFTPCVLPMIPILAGVIAGQQNPSKLRSGWLALCYVLGTIVTYAIAGWVAGAAGPQLQAHFQSPGVRGLICMM